MFTNSTTQKVAVFFGGVSVEHEVSIITAVQLLKHAQKKYDIIPVYIDKSGNWWTGESLFSIEYFRSQDLFYPKNLDKFELNLSPNSNEIDVALLCFHGQYGESGQIQGVLDTAQIPYQGPGVTSSAVCFDKIHQRQILKAENIPQPDYIWFTQEQWQSNPQIILQKISDNLSMPVFVKPANSGSTIGIQKVNESPNLDQDLTSAIAQALKYDHRIIVETGILDFIEVNVSVLGLANSSKASVPEQPLSQEDFLSYADKYQRGSGKKTGMASANRRIPAPISAGTTQKIQDLAQKVFSILGCSGVVRIDFLVNPSTEECLVIEPNAIPGSMSFYLWEASGLPYPELIDQLLTIAYTRQSNYNQIVHSYESNILDNSNN
jgi:D-alanine-D-alanine ligase